MLTEIERLEQFPSLINTVYLNTAAEGIPSLAVHDALNSYFEDKLTGMDGRLKHEAQWNATRQLVAELYGLTKEEIGLCSCTSEAFNHAAAALGLHDGDEVIINDLDFPAGTTPWLQENCPAVVKLWKSRDGALRTRDLIPLLSPRTRLVTTSLVSYYNGYKISLPHLAEAVRQHSPALIALDVTQALGRIPLHLHEADLIVSSTHKWILGTHGGGLVGVPKHRARHWHVPAGGWFNIENAFGPGRFEQAQSHAGAAGFSVGMPNYPAVYANRAALSYINKVGIENIENVTRPLVEQTLAELQQMPVELLTPPHLENIAGIIAFRHPKSDEINNHLHNRNIHIMSHAGRLRVAIHGYNTQKDIETFLGELHAALNQVS